jgi:hypothetical protein
VKTLAAYFSILARFFPRPSKNFDLIGANFVRKHIRTQLPAFLSQFPFTDNNLFQLATKADCSALAK